jgi:hypothetical protein
MTGFNFAVSMRCATCGAQSKCHVTAHCLSLWHSCGANSSRTRSSFYVTVGAACGTRPPTIGDEVISKKRFYTGLR